MIKKQKTMPEKHKTGINLLLDVRAGFIRKHTTFHRWCLVNGVDRRNAERALAGDWKGPKGQKLRERICKAALDKLPPVEIAA